MSTKVQSVVKVEDHKITIPRKDAEKSALQRRSSNSFSKKQKHDFKSNRKRSQSFNGNGKIFLYNKRRKKETTLPTKFLLGGNICDPLNLNSLQDEEINRAMNAVTPKSSPIPTPPRRRAQIEVIIPPDICDPLNLISGTDDATYEKQLCSPIKRGRKKSNRKKQRTSSNAAELAENNNTSVTETQVPEENSEILKTPDVENNSLEVESSPNKETCVRNLQLNLPSPPPKDKAKRKSTEDCKDMRKVRRVDSMDKIVSPVIPQPGAWKRPPNFTWGGGNVSKSNSRAKEVKLEKIPNFKEKNKQYQFGNYNRYYGYRNPHNEVDLRLKCFVANKGMFLGKDVLDIGCNIGHITLSIARDFGAKSVVGLDIDKKLINIARKNICYYVNCDSPNDESSSQGVRRKGKKSTDKFFPISMPILYGPVDVPGMGKMDKGKGFPHNVTFVQGNYILEDDNLLTMENPQFDVILALSITKWIHLNWGDAGLKQAFRRMYAQLRPGGRLILEPQAWSSYVKKKALTENIYKNYHTIDFFPQNFTQYLLSSEVGFAKSEVLGCPSHHSKGFQRPIFVFTKSNLSPLYSQHSATSTPSYTITSSTYKSNIYSQLTSPNKPNDVTQNLNKPDSDQEKNIKEISIKDTKMDPPLGITNPNIDQSSDETRKKEGTASEPEVSKLETKKVSVENLKTDVNVSSDNLSQEYSNKKSEFNKAVNMLLPTTLVESQSFDSEQSIKISTLVNNDQNSLKHTSEKNVDCLKNNTQVLIDNDNLKNVKDGIDDNT